MTPSPTSRASSACRLSRPPARTTRHRSRAGWRRRWRLFAGGGVLTRPTLSCRRARERICGPAPRWQRCSPGTRRPFPPPRRSARNARSICTWWRRNCRPTTSRPGMTRIHICGSSLSPAQHTGTAPPEQRPDAYEQIEKELRIIADLNFPGYFLIVHDIVDFCRRADIFCQGRGSAANSAVCYALGITAVDAVRYQLLFERFLGTGKGRPAGHRYRHRIRPQGRGHPVRLPAVRP